MFETAAIEKQTAAIEKQTAAIEKQTGLQSLMCSLISEQNAAIDEQTAVIVNALKPGTFEECTNCNKLSSKPYRTHEPHGDDFCTIECMASFIEDQAEGRVEEAEELAYAKMEGIKDWQRIFEEDGQIVCGVKVVDSGTTITPDDEQMGGVETEQGWVKIPYATADGTHFCDCVCETCEHAFQIDAHKLLRARKNPCPNCKKT